MRDSEPLRREEYTKPLIIQRSKTDVFGDEKTDEFGDESLEVEDIELSLLKNKEKQKLTKLNEKFNKIEKQKLIHNWDIDPTEIKFVEKIGEGTYCSVYKGLYRQQTCALKVLKSMDHKQIKNFISELDIVAQFRCPDVIYFFGACLEPIPVLIFGFCAKGSLYNVLKSDEESIGWPLAYKMCYQIARGLNSMHCWIPQIVHRDLKSKNILVESNYQIKLCDFGESRFIDENNDSLTKMCGTFAYVSPEVYFGKIFFHL